MRNKLEKFQHWYSKVSKIYIVEIIIILIIISIVVLVLLSFPISAKQVKTLFSDLITTSGIISGIAIVYLATKIFQIRNERIERASKIHDLSLKLTAFRKIVYFFLHSYDFWVSHSDIMEFRKIYLAKRSGKLNNSEIHEEYINILWSGDEDWHRSSIDLYMSMETIVDETDSNHGFPFDPGYEPEYSVQQIDKYWNPTNVIWYYLFGRYYKHMNGMVNDDRINRIYESDMHNYATRISPKYRNHKIDHVLVAKISADFYSVYLPKLKQLSLLNLKGPPKSSLLIYSALVLIALFGVILPLIMQSISLEGSITYALSVVCVTAVITGILGVLLLIFNVLIDEIKIEGIGVG